VDEVGLPKRAAMKLTIPETVWAGNMAEMTRRVRIGHNDVRGAEKIVTDDGKVFFLSHMEQEVRNKLQLEIGWKVHRYIKDGDYVLMNRQPSLHHISMMAHKAKLMKNSALRLNMSVTAPYNADFDGMLYFNFNCY
jgi:DNA-directed RNA polymerase II subunit RPB1